MIFSLGYNRKGRWKQFMSVPMFLAVVCNKVFVFIRCRGSTLNGKYNFPLNIIVMTTVVWLHFILHHALHIWNLENLDPQKLN
jgi:hypothetical protein